MFGINKRRIENKQIAEMLKTTPEALKAFEEAYADRALSEPDGSFFGMSAAQAKRISATETGMAACPDGIIERIVSGLMTETEGWDYDGKTLRKLRWDMLAGAGSDRELHVPVSKEELMAIEEASRPQLTETLMSVDCPAPSYQIVLQMYRMFRTEKNKEKAVTGYHMFRQGLDTMDLDPVLYAVLGMNRNSMGYWFPAVCETAPECGLRIPKTRIIKVPLPLLQLSRIDYEWINRSTRTIVDRYCGRVFDLDERNDYFVKTGVYSSKFDFRNAHVPAGKEVLELGEYLLYISHRAVMMAGPLTQPSVYGAATTNEWVVREFIPDSEGSQTIYKGLPLRTEYRVFVDFDRGAVLGMNPYWDPEVMEKRFAEGSADGSAHDTHDAITFAMEKDRLMSRYELYKDRVKDYVGKLAKEIRNRGDLRGQWSVDVMQNGDDFWLIDMALAKESAFYTKCVPEDLRRELPEEWIPKIPEVVPGQGS